MRRRLTAQVAAAFLLRRRGVSARAGQQQFFRPPATSWTYSWNAHARNGAENPMVATETNPTVKRVLLSPS